MTHPYPTTLRTVTAIVLAAESTGWVAQLTNWLVDVSAARWFLLVIALIALFDSVIPAVPSETTVIIGGVAAGAGDQHLLLVILAGMIGAFIGDNIAFTIGRRLAGPIRRRASRKTSTAARLEWAASQIRNRGGLLLVTARFIPGGRTALTISCGLTQQPRPWFLRWVAIAVTIWASYAAVLGAVFGRAFQDNHTAAFLVAFGTALGVNIIIEVTRKMRERRHHVEVRHSGSEP